MHVPTRQKLGDEIRWVKFSGASWTHDNKGFFYSRFPEPEAGQKFQGLPLNQKLYYHRLGTPQSEDVLVYQRPEQPDLDHQRRRHRRWPVSHHLHRRRHHQPQDSGRLQGFERTVRHASRSDRQLRFSEFVD